MISKILGWLVSLLPDSLLMRISKSLVNTVIFITYDKQSNKAIVLQVLQLMSLKHNRFVEVLCQDLRGSKYQLLLSDKQALKLSASNKYMHSIKFDDVYIKRIKTTKKTTGN